MNPMQLIQMIRSGKNPEQMVIQLLEKNMANTPVGTNLLQLAKNNDIKGIEQIARNIVQQQGKDFDQEFSSFKSQLGL